MHGKDFDEETMLQENICFLPAFLPFPSQQNAVKLFYLFDKNESDKIA
jgi:hypothetical protein